MKALSLTQPWASLIALKHKSIETRSWQTRFRGRIAIHAAKGYPASARAFAHSMWENGLVPPMLPLGEIVGTALLLNCVLTQDVVANLSALERTVGDGPGRYTWLLSEVRQLPQPIPCCGALGLWTVPVEIEQNILAGEARR